MRTLFTCCAALAIGALLAPIGGCGSTPTMTTPVDDCTSGKERALVMAKIAFAPQTTPGVSVGFDLDKHVATGGDPLTCGHASLRAPDGTQGIDNAFSSALPTIEMATNNALAGELQDAINGGMLLIGLDLQHVDDSKNDGCVDLTFSRLTGKVTVGTDKILDANQTFDTDHASPISKVRGAIVGGKLTAGPFELQMPIKILDADFVLPVHGAYVTFDLNNDAAITGVLGGALAVADVVTELSKYAIGDNLKKMLPDLLAGIADQAPDAMTSKCARFSTALNVSAKTAFINP